MPWHCPHCGNQAAPLPDGTCPSCQTFIDGPPAAEVSGAQPKAEDDSSKPASGAPPLSEPEIVSSELAESPPSAERTFAELVAARARLAEQTATGRPAPGFWGAVGLTFFMVVLSSLITLLFLVFANNVLQDSPLDDLTWLAIPGASVAMGLLGWVGLNANFSRKVALRAPRPLHILVAVFLPLALSTMYFGMERGIVQLRSGPEENAAQGAVAGRALSPVGVGGDWNPGLFERATRAYQLFVWQPWLVVLLAGCLLPAMGAEVFFRGLVGRGLVSNYGVYVGVPVTAVLFGLMHVAPGWVVYTTLTGVVFHLSYLWCKSIWIPFTMHLVNNMIFFSILKLTMEYWVPAEIDGSLPLSWWVVPAAAVAAAAMLWLLYKTRVTWCDRLGEPIRLPFDSVETPLDPTAIPRAGGAAVRDFAVAAGACLLFIATMIAQRTVLNDRWDALTHMREGNRLFGAREYERAAESFAEAVRLDPSLAPAHCGLGSCSVFLEEPDQAEEHANRALAILPDYATAFAVRAEAHRQRGQTGDAVANARWAVHLSPDDSWCHSILAMAEEWDNHWQAAFEAAERAIELTPSDPYALSYRAHLLVTAPVSGDRHIARGIREATTACELSSWHDANSLAILGECYLAKGDIEQAIRFQEQAVEYSTAKWRTYNESTLAHYRQIGPPLIELRRSQNTDYIDDIRLQPTHRRLLLVVPVNLANRLQGMKVDLPEFASWLHETLTAEEYRKRILVAVEEFDALEGLNRSQSNIVATYLALSMDELSLVEPAALQAALGVKIEEAQAILQEAKKRTQ